MEETSAVATVREPVPDYRLIARNPAELEASRLSLMKFFNAKLTALEQERSDLDANLSIATRFPIRTQPITAQLNRVQKRIDYYTKARAAVEAGFHIIPNFEADVFAIRRKKPASGQSALTTHGAQNAINRMPMQLAESLPVGEGRYENPTPTGYTNRTVDVVNGQEIVKHWATVADFADGIDFPFALARPEVLTASQQVMALKIFDQIGALPRTNKNSDPMVVGIINEIGGKSSWKGKRMTFLVVWFLDTNTL